MTDELVRLRDWLLAAGVSHVAMESSGVYWKPVYNLLEDQGMELLVVNARHVKAVPGRKTDVKDAEWLAELLQHGLLKASFIPDRESLSGGNWSATDAPWSSNARTSFSACRSCWRGRTSSWATSPAT